MKLLEDILVLDFSQYLSGPWAAMRLADLGARVIKIESPRGGDGCRQLTLKNLKVDGDSTVFHSMNRNKESYSANLKDPDDLARVKKLIEKADVLIGNFRPGIMAKFGLDYDAVKEINPQIVYASITGYGTTGPWKEKPGQDLLLQSLTGIPYLNGNGDQQPVPVGLAVVDMFTSANAVQGILASLIKRMKSGVGCHLEVSMLEAAVDYQFEVVTTYLNDGGELPNRSKVNNAHAYVAAPYGIYKTKDSYIALAMGSILQLGELLKCPPLLNYQDQKTWHTKRDEIKQILADHLITQTTTYWLSILEPADYWCAAVNTMTELMEHEGMKEADMIQEVTRKNGAKIRTTRCPMRVNGEKLFSSKGSPVLGEDTDCINEEFKL
ncbi:CaiB/BaiF CoA transferase family protein [Clostridium grantii]|uniref:Crotonobetainyl-CoA:carnitine CoA-transferase CaiB n=1 Tax=Clostridium grantii DSM 8605 TaxID=1121316 RepID=A0A1M5WAL6_9CLOT|nr:CaiB/BaiF CoA-transferase family protein [Clostridium grantii]SHH84507.1 Crotonobetainyl-CoA:carnitine CoA-transferase CaiB [Clostridium grantii DSM 8605]